MAVYLIHLDSKLSDHAQHYLGFVENDLETRLKRHRKGIGAKMLKAANEAGIEYKVVRTWPDGDRNFERKIKNQSRLAAYCPICREAQLVKERARRKAWYIKNKHANAEDKSKAAT